MLFTMREVIGNGTTRTAGVLDDGCPLSSTFAQPVVAQTCADCGSRGSAIAMRLAPARSIGNPEP